MIRSSLLIILLLFLGCASKDRFIPKDVKNQPLKTKSGKILEDYTNDSLTFKALRLKYVKPSVIDDGVRGQWVYYDINGTKLGKFEKIDASLAKDGSKLMILPQKKIISLPEIVYTAKKRGDIVAIVFNNNAVGVYDLKKDKLILYKAFAPSIGVRYESGEILFYKGLILFPLLNANVAVVENNRYLKNINIGEGEFNDNIIFMKIVNNSLFIATPQRLILFDPNYLINYDADIKHIISDDKYIYLFLVTGEVVKLDSNLKVIKKTTLEFADFSAPSFCRGDIYTISGDYLIKLNKDLNTTVYEGNKFDYGYPLKIKGCKIYNANKVYLIE
ncbi:MAG: hypothetical protein GXO62_07665 [Epsilonproteobacteria bacterium]|nr:hypothetical protein [Campylobacterota bacterium]